VQLPPLDAEIEQVLAQLPEGAASRLPNSKVPATIDYAVLQAYSATPSWATDVLLPDHNPPCPSDLLTC
jgi:hypothetical protein